MEIERKYLVRELPDNLDSFPHTEIEQAYLSTSPTLRIRRMGDTFILTVKERRRTSTTAIVNREEEFALSAESYERLRDKCDGKITGTKMVFKFLMCEIDLLDFPRYDLIVIIRIAQRFGCFNF